MDIILSGIVGSTAYGLSREGSDVDRLGIFVAPTLAVAGLDWSSHKETVVTTKPDSTFHEAGKFLRLALACNPTILELLFLPDDLYETVTSEGGEVIDARNAFLWEKGVRNAYGGYARQQAQRLANRDDGTFSSDTRNRTVKHARHILRLLRQGRALLETGHLNVAVDNPEDYWAFGDMTTGQMIDIYQREDALFQQSRSVLPSEPDRAGVAELLRLIRHNHVDDADS